MREEPPHPKEDELPEDARFLTIEMYEDVLVLPVPEIPEEREPEREEPVREEEIP
jgi:hypothetical protein